MNTFKAILFVEDDAMQRELTTRLYQMCAKVFHGEVLFLTASSWEEAMKIVSEREIDVLISDLTLPPMSKEDTLLAVKSTPDLPPVIALTGNDSDLELRRISFEHGVDDFLLKTDVNHRPEALCERAYHAFLRRENQRGPRA